MDLTNFPEYFSIGDTLTELERHVHNSLQVYGLTSNTMARKAVTPIVVTAGSGAWGTELELHNGTVIESGSTVKKFDLNQMFITAVGTANRNTILEFYTNELATAITSVAIDETGGTVEDMFTSTAHGLSDGDKIMLSSIVTTTGINAYTVYYVVNKSDNYFQVSLTSGGAVVAVTGDGTCSVSKITATLLTETFVSRAATAPDSNIQFLMSRRSTCNKRISCRGWAASGTNAISFFLGLHTYEK